MPSAVKVPTSSKPKPRIISVEQSRREKLPVYEPDIVRVKALTRGYYGIREPVKHPGTGQTKIERNPTIRNEGEVFEMDTGDMRPYPLREIPPDGLGGADGETKGNHMEQPHAGDFGITIIETGAGQFELPSWVTLDEAQDLTAEAGHKLSFGKKEGEVL